MEKSFNIPAEGLTCALYWNIEILNVDDLVKINRSVTGARSR